MELSQKELNKGLKFIVGTWEVDFLVNPFSNNLDHLPAEKFQTTTGKDLSKLTWEFFEDHTVKLRNGATGEEETCTWKQVSDDKFTYDTKFLGLIDNEDVLKGIRELSKSFGSDGLVFSMIMVISLKKTKEGEVHIVEEPKEPDIGDIEPTAEDLKMKDIVGRWSVYKSFASVGDNFGLFTRAEVEADFEKKKKEGKFESEEEYKSGLSEALSMFGAVVEFCEDHKTRMYTPIPAGVSQQEIDEALASGEVKLVDGMIFDGCEKEWKAVKGDYWYNTGEHREVFGEIKSPWDKITPDSEGHIDFRMFVLEKKK